MWSRSDNTCALRKGERCEPSGTVSFLWIAGFRDWAALGMFGASSHSQLFASKRSSGFVPSPLRPSNHSASRALPFRPAHPRLLRIHPASSLFLIPKRTNPQRTPHDLNPYLSTLIHKPPFKPWTPNPGP